MIPGLLLGGWLGSGLAVKLDDQALRWIVAGYCLIAAAQMLFGKARSNRDGSAMEAPVGVPMTAAGAGIGALSAVVGIGGYLLALARFSPALLLLGFVLGPLIETHLRRAMLISRGDPMVFLERPIACGFVIATALLILLSIWQAVRR